MISPINLNQPVYTTEEPVIFGQKTHFLFYFELKERENESRALLEKCKEFYHFWKLARLKWITVSKNLLETKVEETRPWPIAWENGEEKVDSSVFAYKRVF